MVAPLRMASLMAVLRKLWMPMPRLPSRRGSMPAASQYFLTSLQGVLRSRCRRSKPLAVRGDWPEEGAFAVIPDAGSFDVNLKGQASCWEVPPRRGIDGSLKQAHAPARSRAADLAADVTPDAAPPVIGRSPWRSPVDHRPRGVAESSSPGASAVVRRDFAGATCRATAQVGQVVDA